MAREANDQAVLANYRSYVASLMRKRELPTRRVTVMHRDIFGHAGVAWKDGQSMDECLDGLHMGELIALAKLLRDDEEGDDDA
jgi:hypothetical protein